MTKQNKIDLLTRLVKEGHITLCEAFDLLEPTKENYINPFPKAWVEVIPSNPYITGPHNPYTITM